MVFFIHTNYILQITATIKFFLKTTSIKQEVVLKKFNTARRTKNLFLSYVNNKHYSSGARGAEGSALFGTFTTIVSPALVPGGAVTVICLPDGALIRN